MTPMAPDAVAGPNQEEVASVSEVEGTPLTDAQLLTGGRAARTYRVQRHTWYGSSDAILRIEGEGGPTEGVALSVRDHHALLSSLAPHGIPAPRPLGVGRVVTGSYLLTTLLPGDVPSPWSRTGRAVLGAEPLRSRLPAQCAATLTAIHATPLLTLRGLTPATEVRPADELDRWRRVLDETAFGRDPLIRWCSHLVERGLPATVPATLVHGDFRLGNLVVADGSLTGVLDWELATVGDPVLDLGLLCAPPVAADWERCGLDPVGRLVDQYLEGKPEADDMSARLSVVTLLATLKVVSLWVNGARLTGASVTADQARCGLNALGSRQYLADCLRPGVATRGVAPADGRTARASWRSGVEQVLNRAKEEGRWDGAVLPDRLVAVPPPAPSLGEALLADVARVASRLGLDPTPELDPAAAVTALVDAYVTHEHPSAAADGLVQELVLRTVEPELAPRPW